MPSRFNRRCAPSRHSGDSSLSLKEPSSSLTRMSACVVAACGCCLHGWCVKSCGVVEVQVGVCRSTVCNAHQIGLAITLGQSKEPACTQTQNKLMRHQDIPTLTTHQLWRFPQPHVLAHDSNVILPALAHNHGLDVHHSSRVLFNSIHLELAAGGGCGSE